MVASQQEEILRVLNFVGQQEADGLQGLLAPVHVVPQKQVVGFRRETSVLEEPQEVIVLAVDVTCKGPDDV